MKESVLPMPKPDSIPFPSHSDAESPRPAPFSQAGVVLLGLEPANADDIRRRLRDQRIDGTVQIKVPSEVEGPESFDEPPAVLCLGPALDAARGRDLLERCLKDSRFREARLVVLGSGDESPRYYDLLAADRLFFLAAEPLDAEWTAALIRGALLFDPARPTPTIAPSPADAEPGEEEPLDLLLGDVFGRQDPKGLVNRTALMIERLVDADRVDCLRFDPEDTALSSFRFAGGEAHSASAGTVSLALRSGRTVIFDHVGESPCFDPDLDDMPDGDGTARFLALPMVPQGAGPGVVWVAWREAEKPPFSSADRQRAASTLAPLHDLMLQLATRESLKQHTYRSHRDDADPRLRFRAEALDHYHDGLSEHGNVLRISPEWTRYAYPLLLLLLAATLVFSIFGHIHEYAEGVALVRLDGRTDVTAPVGGTVSAVSTTAGRDVAEGDLLVKLYDVQEEAELRRVRREFELGLLERLRRPADPAAARALGALRAQWQLAASRLEERSVRAPADGTISDLRVEAGRLLSPGEVILSLRKEEQTRRLMVVLPGKYRPQVEPGMQLRFEPEGFRYAYQHLEVDRVSDEIFGPAEARRILGPVAGDTVPLDGPVMLVEARLPSASFASQGRTYTFHDGSLGRAELRIRSEPILLTLVPGLKALWAPRSNDSGGPE